MTVRHTHITSQPWFPWVIASAIGAIVGMSIFVFSFMVALYTIMALDIIKIMTAIFMIGISAASVGAAVGLIQWLILQRRVSRVGLWMLATASVFFVGFYVAVFAIFAFSTQGLIVGTLLGTIQWLILLQRRHVSKNTLWWPLLPAVGWAGCGTVFDLLVRGFDTWNWFAALAFDLILGGKIAATSLCVIVGITFAWLLWHLVHREPPQANPDAETD